MYGLGIEKLLLLGVVVLLLFGAKRLPEIGTSLGKGIRGFKGSLHGDDHDGDPPAVVERSVRDDVREPKRLGTRTGSRDES